MLTRGRKSKNKITKEATKKQTHGRRKKETQKDEDTFARLNTQLRLVLLKAFIVTRTCM